MRSRSLWILAWLAAWPVSAAAKAPTVAAAEAASVADVPGVTRGFVDSAGVRLQYLDFGGEGPAVVLLAGLGNTAWIWSEFAPRLAREGFRVVALTRRAHGESEAPARGYDLDTLGSDVIALMDALAIPRAHLVGHSLAGAELTNVASRFPKRVARLVYVDAAYDRAAQLRYDAVASAPELAPDLTSADRASLRDYLSYQRAARPDLARCWSAAVERDFTASLVQDAAGELRWRHPLARYGEIMGSAAASAPDYSEVEAPALAVYATVSQSIVPADASEAVRAAFERYERENNAPWTAGSVAGFEAGMRHGQVTTIAGVHHLFLDQPDATLSVIVGFLRD